MNYKFHAFWKFKDYSLVGCDQRCVIWWMGANVLEKLVTSIFRIEKRPAYEGSWFFIIDIHPQTVWHHFPEDIAFILTTRRTSDLIENFNLHRVFTLSLNASISFISLSNNLHDIVFFCYWIWLLSITTTTIMMMIIIIIIIIHLNLGDIWILRMLLTW
jgi:hypothetical protein